ncbi:unnamed protein product [Moneuplotes crassus]|uniref:Uncharacterized protein n=1 Tax=Euplotes crassus TaxID=5936 RepID=A0AAD1U5V5_EUPCR|nr:unnamed protein product [Moneuplotes crassus]
MSCEGGLVNDADFSAKIRAVLKAKREKEPDFVNEIKQMKIFSSKNNSTQRARNITIRRPGAKKSTSTKFSPEFLGFETSISTKAKEKEKNNLRSLSPRKGNISPVMHVSNLVNLNFNRNKKLKMSGRKNGAFSPQPPNPPKPIKSSTLHTHHPLLHSTTKALDSSYDAIEENRKLRCENMKLKKELKQMKEAMFAKEQEWKKEERRLTMDQSKYHKGVKYQIYLKFKDQIKSLKSRYKEDVDSLKSKLHKIETESKNKYDTMKVEYVGKINGLYSLVSEKSDIITDLESKIEDYKSSINDLKESENDKDNYTLVTVNNALRINLKRAENEIRGLNQKLDELSKAPCSPTLVKVQGKVERR